MTLKEANELQKLVALSHPWLEVDIKKVELIDNDAWVCYFEIRHYQWYAWATQDWLNFKAEHAKGLYMFTDEGRMKRTAIWRKSRNAKKKRSKVA